MRKYHISGHVRRPLIPRTDAEENPYSFYVDDEFESESLDMAIREFKQKQADKYYPELPYITVFSESCYEIMG